ncbi:PREDICTED: E3 ubiquitin protein ligase DRIP2 isoform X2 [Tarenaya hassleriana]|uniref:E3 ubiquitin protein ligase DRIP2 isoform X2 n=1 Tax=Tarenaya hassleriana TaxID=28532 RepID=UPI00053C4742|nr:PREDICTED: E3 ubiquitin protein ligase DRIP2 isoform X2 [Tarenaya hassleriana]
MATQVAKVRREAVAACMTCPLCNKLLRDATTISECLHSFCRKCIYEKITEEEIECCPVCNIDLGGAPLEKLRPDHNLQDLRAKIFPLKRRKVEVPEVVPSITLPARRKERSISSLVVSTPRVLAQAGTTGRRTKAVTRKDVRGSGSLAERTVKKEEDSEDDNTERRSSPETLDKFTQNKRQSSYAEPGHTLSNEETRAGDEPWDSKLDLWKPLNFLVEVANRTKPLKSSTSQGLDSKYEHANAPENEGQTSKRKTKDHKSKFKVEDEKNNKGDPTASETATPKRLRRTRRKRSASFGDSRILPQPDAPNAKWERRDGPVWFSLVASSDQEGEPSLPQIPANYLRIKDGNIPVSFIQKYLMRKLDLESETEVEIRCMGEPVIPTLQLHSLMDLWLQTSSKHKRVAASIGSSAKDFVMVLVYARKIPVLESNK